MISREQRAGVWLSMPLVIATTLLVLIPALVTFVFAFTDYDGLSTLRWNNYANFSKLWKDPLFWTSLKN